MTNFTETNAESSSEKSNSETSTETNTKSNTETNTARNMNITTGVSSNALTNITILPKHLASYSLVSKNIHGIEAIDYFFAKELTSIFKSAQNTDLIFHLLMALSESLRNGHTCLPLNKIANVHYGVKSEKGNYSHQGFQFPPLADLVNLLENVDITPEHNQAIVYFEGALYTRRYFSFERTLKLLISEKNHNGSENSETAEAAIPEVNIAEIKACLAQLFPEKSELNNTDAEIKSEIDWQYIAVANALNKNFSVIAGGPGTGKTYTVTKLLAALVMLDQQKQKTSAKNLNISLVAPTGKAAQRLSESIIDAVNGFKGLVPDSVLADIPDDAQTIHRLLGVIPNKVQFKHNANNLLNIDVLLVDEVSMVDLALMTRLLQAIPTHCKVILLGDADQLPSVAIGSVLADIAPRPHPGYSKENIAYLSELIGQSVQVGVIKDLPCAKKKVQTKTNSTNSECDHLTILTKSRRFDGEGGIGKLAQAVIQGDVTLSWKILNNEIKAYDELHCYKGELTSWLSPLIEQYYLPIFECSTINDAFNALQRFRILCATRVGEQGVEFINELVRAILAKHLPDRFSGVKQLVNEQPHKQIFHAQPIMISENNYQLGLYNGDIGFIWRQENGQLLAGFPDVNASNEAQGVLAIKWIMPTRLPNYETVYAMTIHKTQGSEFEHVAMVLPASTENRLLSRELLYTAITRAKKQLSVGCAQNVWHSGVELQVQRHSGFNK